MSYFSAEQLEGGLGCGSGCNCGPCRSGMSGLGQRYEVEEKDALSLGYYGWYGDETPEVRPEPAPVQESTPAPAEPAPVVTEPRPAVPEPRSTEVDQTLLREALSRGIRSPRRLTDIIFFARHPPLKTNPAWANDGALLDEWRQIRERIVLPEVLQRFAPRHRVLRRRRMLPARLHGPSHFGFGYFAAPAVCEPARHDLESIAFDVRMINNELAKGSGASPRRLSLKQDLLNLDVDGMISSLDSYIVSGCCEPGLKTLESEVKALPWPALVDPTRVRLIREILAAQGRARKDFNHC